MDIWKPSFILPLLTRLFNGCKLTWELKSRWDGLGNYRATHWKAVFQAIHKIVVFKRLGYPQRTTNVEARVGNTRVLRSNHGQIKVNEKCGKTSGSNSAKMEEFHCFPPLDGQYVSLQSMESQPQSMNIGELSIFKSGRQCWKSHRGRIGIPHKSIVSPIKFRDLVQQRRTKALFKI